MDRIKGKLAAFGYQGSSAKRAVNAIFDWHLQKFGASKKRTVYRAIFARPDEEALDEQWKRYGLMMAWGSDKHNADLYVFRPTQVAMIPAGVQALIEADVHFSDIDWTETIHNNLEFGASESEINPYPGAKMFVRKVSFYTLDQKARRKYYEAVAGIGKNWKPWIDPKFRPVSVWEPKQFYPVRGPEYQKLVDASMVNPPTVFHGSSVAPEDMDGDFLMPGVSDDPDRASDEPIVSFTTWDTYAAAYAFVGRGTGEKKARFAWPGGEDKLFVTSTSPLLKSGYLYVVDADAVPGLQQVPGAAHEYYTTQPVPLDVIEVYELKRDDWPQIIENPWFPSDTSYPSALTDQTISITQLSNPPLRTFSGIKEAHEHYGYAGSHRVGTIVQNGVVVRSYSNNTGHDVIKDEGKTIQYMLKDDKIRGAFANNRSRKEPLRFFLKTGSNEVTDMGMYDVVRIQGNMATLRSSAMVNPRTPGGKKVPTRYLKGLTKLERMIAEDEIDKGYKYDVNDPEAYKFWKSDIKATARGLKIGSSKHKEEYYRRYRQNIDPDYKPSGKTPKQKFLNRIRKETGIKKSILEKTYDKGLAAWRTGHRPGVQQHQWAAGRVYALAVGADSSTGPGKPDHSLAVEAGVR